MAHSSFLSVSQEKERTQKHDDCLISYQYLTCPIPSGLVYSMQGVNVGEAIPQSIINPLIFQRVRKKLRHVKISAFIPCFSLTPTANDNREPNICFDVSEKHGITWIEYKSLQIFLLFLHKKLGG